jgi:hypothetical protein
MLEADRSLTISGWFARGWETYKKHSWPLIGAAIIVQLLGLISSIAYIATEWGFLSGIVGFIIAPVLSVGWFYLSLRALRGEDVDALKIFDAFSRFGTAWGTTVLAGLAICVGLILLIVPGFVIAMMFFAAPFVVMDKKTGVIESLRLSCKITKGFKGRLFGMICLATLLSLFGILFTMGLQYKAPVIIAIGVLPYLVMVFVITPWLGATYAAAYDGLIKYAESDRGGLSESSGQVPSE